MIKFLNPDFYELLECLKNEYDRVKDSNKRLYDKLQEYSKDAEIQRANEQATYCASHSLHSMTDAERDANAKFRKKHYEKCHNANRYFYELVGTGIGEAIIIKCPVCGEEENITDYDSW